MATDAVPRTTDQDDPAAAPCPPARWFWRYWIGGTVSRVGDTVTLVALPLAAVGLAHATSFEVGVLAAAQLLGWIFIGLPAGVLVQRLPLRGSQIAMDLLRAALLLSIPLVWWLTGRLGVTQLILVVTVNGFASVVFDVGNSTMMPFLVSKEELTRRNSLTSAAEAGTQLAGPSLGGLLVQAAGAAGTLVVDVVSYVVSAVVLSRVPRPPRQGQPADRARASVRESIRVGWHHVVGHPILRPAMLDAAAINFVCGAITTLTPLFLVRTLGLHAAAVGLLYASEGVGSLIGAALTPRIATRIGSARAALVAALLLPLTVALLPLATDGAGTLLFALGDATFAVAVVVSSIVFRTHRHTETPADLLPRVMATVRFVSWGVNPLGALAAGAVATWAGPRETLWWTSAAALVPAVILLASPVRTRRDLAETGR
jgi:MFS family permease